MEGATLKEILENESYSALAKIREIIRNHKLDDRECFEEIEQIVLIYEEMGSNGGSRHDFWNIVLYFLHFNDIILKTGVLEEWKTCQKEIKQLV